MAITLEKVLFIIFAVITLGAGLRVVTARQLFHAALWMVLSFFGVAALYMLLQFPFMAGLQMFIYIGGIAVLIVVAVMITRQMMEPRETVFNDPLVAASLAFLMFAGLAWLILQPGTPAASQLPWPTEAPVALAADGGLVKLGTLLVSPGAYLIPFEVASVMLVVVLIGALYLGRER